MNHQINEADQDTYARMSEGLRRWLALRTEKQNELRIYYRHFEDAEQQAHQYKDLIVKSKNDIQQVNKNIDAINKTLQSLSMVPLDALAANKIYQLSQNALTLSGNDEVATNIVTHFVRRPKSFQDRMSYHDEL